MEEPKYWVEGRDEWICHRRPYGHVTIIMGRYDSIVGCPRPKTMKVFPIGFRECAVNVISYGVHRQVLLDLSLGVPLCDIPCGKTLSNILR